MIASDPKAGLPQMKPNLPKILEAILHVISLGEKTGRPATQFEIAQTIFLADCRHLDTDGRPVTFDNFVAMEHGPVPSVTYDMLKPEFNWAKLNRRQPPWKTKPAGNRARFYFGVEREADLRKLSQTDAALLASSFSDVRAMGFGKTSDITHKIPAYKKAWDKRGNALASDMDLRELLPEFDDEMISDLQHLSKYASV